MLKAAADDAEKGLVFATRDKIGVMWQNTKVSDAKLQREYNAVGPDMDAKREFRRNWIIKTAKKKAEEFLKRHHIHEDTKGTRATYRSVTKMLRGEGPGGSDAICNLVKFNLEK